MGVSQCSGLKWTMTMKELTGGSFQTKSQGLCMEYLYSGHCVRLDCPLMHLLKQYKFIDSHCHLDHLTSLGMLPILCIQGTTSS